MNVRVSTIGDMFSRPVGPAAADTTRQPASKRHYSDIRIEPPDEGRKDFNEEIRSKTGPDEVQTSLAQESVPVDHASEETAPAVAAKTGQQPDQPGTKSKNGESSPVEGEGRASAELKLLAAGGKNQPPIKTGRPGAPTDISVLNNQTSKNTNAAAIPTPNGPVTDTKAITKDLMTGAPGGNNVKATAIAAETPANSTSETKAQRVAFAPESPASNTEAQANAGTAQTPSNAPNLSRRQNLHNSTNISNASSVNKLDAAGIQTPPGQTEGGNDSGPNGSLNSGAGQLLSQTPPESPIVGQSPTFAVDTRTAAPPEPTLSADSPTSAGEQILESVRSSLSQQTGDKQITIQLNPPELGKVSVKFQEQDAQITGTLEVSKAQTRVEIEQALPQIIRTLAESGIEIKRFEVVLNDSEQSGQQAFKNPSLQDGSFGRHDSSDSDASANRHDTTGDSDDWTNLSGYQASSEFQEMLVREDSIDILV